MCIGIKKRSLNMGSFLVTEAYWESVFWYVVFFLVVVTTSMEA